VKVFITGGTGFIGGHVARRLTEAGHELHCLVRSSSDTHNLQSLGAHLVLGTLNDALALHDGMQGCDVLIHMAGVYSFWEPDMSILERVNVEGTYQVMQAAAAAGVKRVIYLSTVAVFGLPEERPFNEKTFHAPQLTTRYARTKRQAEEIVRQSAAANAMELVILQPGAVIGAGDTRATGQYLNELLRGRLPLMSFSESQMVFLHVADVCEAVACCVTAERAIGQTYLLGDTVMSMWDYLGMISEIGEVRLPYIKFPVIVPTILGWLLTPLSNLVKRPPLWGLSNDQVRMLRDGFVFDGSKAERELGINYRPVKDAVADSVAWVKRNKG
jgi:dihydroflavonol-4-reductase